MYWFYGAKVVKKSDICKRFAKFFRFFTIVSIFQRSLARRSRGIFYRNNRKGNLNKKHFLMAGSWVGVLSVFSRSSVGEIGVNIREDTETSILIKRTFSFLYYCFNISKVTVRRSRGIYYRKRLKNTPSILLAIRFSPKSVLLAIHFFHKSVVYIKHFL